MSTDQTDFDFPEQEEGLSDHTYAELVANHYARLAEAAAHAAMQEVLFGEGQDEIPL